MVVIKEETIINVSAEEIFGFLTQIDSLYKIWHPKDHVFCKVIFGRLSRKRCVFHFLEKMDGLPLYLIVKVSELRQNEYMEYRSIFPLSLLKIGRGYFRIEKISSTQSKLIAYVEYGYKVKFFDKVIALIVKADVIKKHMHEEGANMKIFLENNPNINTSKPVKS